MKLATTFLIIAGVMFAATLFLESARKASHDAMIHQEVTQ